MMGGAPVFRQACWTPTARVETPRAALPAPRAPRGSGRRTGAPDPPAETTRRSRRSGAPRRRAGHAGSSRGGRLGRDPSRGRRGMRSRTTSRSCGGRSERDAFGRSLPGTSSRSRPSRSTRCGSSGCSTTTCRRGTGRSGWEAARSHPRAAPLGSRVRAVRADRRAAPPGAGAHGTRGARRARDRARAPRGCRPRARGARTRASVSRAPARAPDARPLSIGAAGGCPRRLSGRTPHDARRGSRHRPDRGAQELERAILRQDPSLRAPPRASARLAAECGPRSPADRRARR